MTESERVLWGQLRDKKLMGLKFRRQHPISFYVADFYCHKAKLVIEIDGKHHHHKIQREDDINRDEDMINYGLKVIRITNEEVLNDVTKVMLRIKSALKSI